MNIVTLQMAFLNWFFGVLIGLTLFFAVIGSCVTAYYVTKALSSLCNDIKTSIREWLKKRKS